MSQLLSSYIMNIFKLKQKLNIDFVTGLTSAGFFNRFYSTDRLSKDQRNYFTVNENLNQIIFGLCLGDLCITKRGKNPILQFAQGLINESYILHLYDLFKSYCGTAPKHYKSKLDKRTEKTLSLSCFNYYYSLFYIDGIKKYF